MFYLQTSDGEKFFTDKDSDDIKELEKIIESKMGKDAAELYLEMLKYGNAEYEDIIDSAYFLLGNCVSIMEKTLSTSNPNIAMLNSVLLELQRIYALLDV